MRRPRGSTVVTVALGAAAALVALAALWSGVLAPAEGLAVDLMQRLRGPRPLDRRVVVVAIDGPSVDRYGRWPWPRTVLAELVDRLAADGARTIAFDIAFSEPSRSGETFDLRSEDRALAAAMERAGGVVLAFFFEGSAPEVPAEGAGGPAGDGAPADPFRADPDNVLPAAFDVVAGAAEAFPIPAYPAVEPNLDLFAAAAASQGFATDRREAGVSRRQSLAARHRGMVFPSLPLRAVALHTGEPLELARRGGLPEVRLGERRLEVDGGGRLWLSYPGPAESFPAVPVHRVLDGAVEEGAFADKLVFVGATETGIGDVTATPFGVEVPGVMVHATVADNVLRGEFLREAGAPRLLSFAAVLLMGPLVALLVAAVERHLVGSLVAITLVAAWPAVCFAAFLAGGWHLQVVAPAAAGVIALVGSLRYQVGTVDARARFIRSTFERFVSGAVVEEMLRHPERVRLGGERRELTVLFCDIRGFTSISEGLAPDALTDLLNRFFTPMTRLVIEQGGTLDKYMGDALMAFFGAPVSLEDHAERGCRAALAMRAELARLNAAWREEGRLPEGAALGIGIGLNSGEMSVGNMGSDQVFDYTVIGDEVNLGSRVEGLNKLYGTEILVTGSTARAAGERFLLRELDRVRVKGKREAVAIHELLAGRPAPAGLEERVESFTGAVALYRQRRFAEAAAAFRELAQTAEGAPDRPAEILAERCERLAQAPPPDDWDGVETLTSK